MLVFIFLVILLRVLWVICRFFVVSLFVWNLCNCVIVFNKCLWFLFRVLRWCRCVLKLFLVIWLMFIIFNRWVLSLFSFVLFFVEMDIVFVLGLDLVGIMFFVSKLFLLCMIVILLRIFLLLKNFGYCVGICLGGFCVLVSNSMWFVLLMVV